MKIVLSFLAVLMLATTSFAQQKKAADVISFKEVKYNFGKIKQGIPVNYAFAFKNISQQPVVIESATASCGCTTPSWPKAPVMKNKSDKITAGFNAVAPGPFNKTIYVKVVGINQPLELVISGEVLNAADYSKYQSSEAGKKSS